MVGNHDVWPSDQVPGDCQNNNYFNDLLNVAGWKDFLTPNQRETFANGTVYIFLYLCLHSVSNVRRHHAIKIKTMFTITVKLLV